MSTTAKDRNGKEIRVGDRVRYINPRSSNYGSDYKKWFRLGDVYTVRAGVVGNYIGYFEESGGMGEYGSCFELLSSDESEIESLVRKANEGLEAIEKLLERENEVELYSEKNERVLKNIFPSGYCKEYEHARYRVPPKKTFTPFTVGKGWTVRLSEDRKTLEIGCRKYDAGYVRREFKALCTTETHGSSFHDVRLLASRKGISDRGESITWEEAEKILKALEEAGV